VHINHSELMINIEEKQVHMQILILLFGNDVNAKPTLGKRFHLMENVSVYCILYSIIDDKSVHNILNLFVKDCFVLRRNKVYTTIKYKYFS